MKLRILNASHVAIAYPSALLGYHAVHDAMNDADIKRWMMQLMRREVIPMPTPIPGLDFDDYPTVCAPAFLEPRPWRHHCAALPGCFGPVAKVRAAHGTGRP